MNDKQSEPNYYAIIPSEIRYCKEITANAKLLYGEITALCNKEGYCWASNDYFAKLYKVKKETISVWIRSLKENNFIKYEIKENYRRKIFLMGVCEKSHGGMRKIARGVCEKSQYNNTVNNKINSLSATADELYKSINQTTKEPLSSSLGKPEEAASFDFNACLENMAKDKRKDLQIVGAYWKWLGWSFENEEQYQSAIKRDIKMALPLKGYSIERIRTTFKALDKQSSNGEKFSWNLFTCHKWIDNTK